MIESGKVLEADDNIAVVMFKRSTACDKCGACGILKGQNDVNVSLENSLNAKQGDSVLVELQASNFVGATAIAYLFPLAALIIGFVLGYSIGNAVGINNEVLAAILAIAFTVLSFFCLKLIDPVIKRKRKFMPVMVQIIEDKTEET